MHYEKLSRMRVWFFSFLLIFLVLQVDKLEEESSAYLQSVGEATALSSTQQKVETLYTIHWVKCPTQDLIAQVVVYRRLAPT